MEVALKQIYQAYLTCHQGKAKSAQAQQYSAKLLDNMFATQLALHTNTYQPKPYTCFIASNGSKPREIYAADFSDRVVHHLLAPQLEKIINHKFIHHSCANQVGKGSHFGVNALQKMMRQPWKGDFNRLTAPAKHSTGAVKTALPKSTISTTQARDHYKLCTIILKSQRQHNTLPAIKLAQIPAHKQLQNTPANKGLPIGNLTSFILSKQNSSKLNSLFASYIGHFQYAKHHKLVAEKITQFPWLKYFFTTIKASTYQ